MQDSINTAHSVHIRLMINAEVLSHSSITPPFPLPPSRVCLPSVSLISMLSHTTRSPRSPPSIFTNWKQSNAEGSKVLGMRLGKHHTYKLQSAALYLHWLTDLNSSVVLFKSCSASSLARLMDLYCSTCCLAWSSCVSRLLVLSLESARLRSMSRIFCRNSFPGSCSNRITRSLASWREVWVV